MTGKLRRPHVIDKLAKPREVNLHYSLRSSRLIPFIPLFLELMVKLTLHTQVNLSGMNEHKRHGSSVVGGSSHVNYNIVSSIAAHFVSSQQEQKEEKKRQTKRFVFAAVAVCVYGSSPAVRRLQLTAVLPLFYTGYTSVQTKSWVSN